MHQTGTYMNSLMVFRVGICREKQASFYISQKQPRYMYRVNFAALFVIGKSWNILNVH